MAYPERLRSDDFDSALDYFNYLVGQMCSELPEPDEHRKRAVGQVAMRYGFGFGSEKGGEEKCWYVDNPVNVFKQIKTVGRDEYEKAYLGFIDELAGEFVSYNCNHKVFGIAANLGDVNVTGSEKVMLLQEPQTEERLVGVKSMATTHRVPIAVMVVSGKQDLGFVRFELVRPE